MGTSAQGPRDTDVEPSFRPLGFALLGVCLVVAALWLTLMWSFFAWSARCEESFGREDDLYRGFWIAASAAVACASWLAVTSAFRVAAGRKPLRTRAWVAAPLAVAAITAVGQVAVPAPSPTSESCRLELHLRLALSGCSRKPTCAR